MKKGVLFCAHPLEAHLPDSQFQVEYAAAKKAGLAVALFSLERWLDDQKLEITSSDSITYAIYRGWMLTGEDYTQLYHDLSVQGITLLTDPTAYQTTHYFPHAYPYIQTYTAKSLFVDDAERMTKSQLSMLLAEFQNQPILVKDFVKSRKEEWLEACYISSAQDQDQAWKVVQRLIALQAERLNQGLVFRKFEQLQHAGVDQQTEMPLTKEYRLFYLRHQLLSCYPNWQGASDIQIDHVPLEMFQSVAENIPSPFFTMDVAQKENDEWMIIELGDGQVSSLPKQINVSPYYEQIVKILEK